MTGDECARLVNLLIATWPSGVKAFVWTQALTDLDDRHANATYVTLRSEDERPPSVARFMTAYRARTAAVSTRNPRQPTPDCEHCDGCGYEPGSPEYETIGGEPHEYTTLQPCRCRQPAPPARERYDDETLFAP